jgi:Flp pilus assembly protein TadG
MIGFVPRSRRRDGTASVELALMMPILLTLMVGLWEVGRCVQVQNVLDDAARVGARQAASGSFYSSNNNNTPSGGVINLPLPSKGPGPGTPNGYFEVQKFVISYIQSAGLGTTGAHVTIQNKTKNWSYDWDATANSGSGGTYDPGAAADQLDDILVTVTVPYASVQWSTLQLFIPNTTTLTARAEWYSDRNIPVTVSTVFPSSPLLP